MNKSKFRPEAYSYLEEIRRYVFKKTGRRFTDQELHKLEVASRVPASELNLIRTEIAWTGKRKPFFNIHEPVVRSIKNTSLSIKPGTIPTSVVHELGIICVKFPIGISEPLLSGVENFLIAFSDATYHHKTGAMIPGGSVAFTYHTKTSVHSSVCILNQNFEEAELILDTVGETDFELKQRQLISRIGLGVMLLAADPEFIKPVLLKCDHGRNIDLEKLKKRAHQRGLIGYEIGADMEVSPHFRRPHFAIRWTGKGSEIPKLVPVKGAIIHKSKMQEIPTGYEVPF